MADFTISKDTTVKAVKDATKAEVMQVIWNALVEKYGEENVAYVLTGSGQTKKKELAVRAKMVDVGDFEVPACVTVTGACKDFILRKTDKRTFEAFDFDEAKAAYENYLTEKEDKAVAKAKAKADKIAADEKRRAAKQ